MGLFSRVKKGKDLMLVFDIGSSSIGGALFYAQKNGAPEIIYSTRETIEFEEKLDFEKFLNSSIKSLEIVVNRVCMAKLGAPKRVFCTLASPWHASQTRVIKLSKEKEFVFNTKFADNLIQEEIKLFEEHHLKKYLAAGEKIRPIELKNMKTKLNGYLSKSPMNQKAREVEMTVFISMSPEHVLKRIEEAIAKHFHWREIKFSSFAVSAFTVARDVFVQQDNFLLVDIGGEITDISMVKQDVLQQSISFPIGRNGIIRGVASAFNYSLDEAKSFLSLYKDDHISEEARTKFKPVVDKLKSEWLKNFQKSLVDLSNDISIPSTVFITVEKELAEFFSDTIKSEQFNQYTLTESKFQIVFLGTGVLHGVASFKEDVVRDPFLIIDSIYINRFLI